MNSPQEYAGSLYIARTEKNDTDFDRFYDNFLGLIKVRSHEKMIPGIITAFEGILEESNGGGVQVLVAAEEDAIKYKSEIEQHQDVVGNEYKIVVDPNIVGGYVVRSNKVQIDNSYRTRLLDLYHSLKD